VNNGTVADHAVVATIKQHPFVRQWASMQVAFAHVFQEHFRNTTLRAALQTVDNSVHSPHCVGDSVAARYFSAWEPALTASLVSTASVPNGTLFVPHVSVLQQHLKNVSAASNAPCTGASINGDNGTLADVNCCDMSAAKAHIVTSHCREDLQVFQQRITRVLSLPAVSQLQPCLFIYTKCGQAQQVRQALPASVQVVELDNVAREGHTYLTHIINHYDSMPGHMIFLQAGVEGFDGVPEQFKGMCCVLERLATLNQTTGFLNLGFWLRTAVHYNELPYWKGTLVRLAEVYSWVYQDLVPEVLDLTYRGQFVVAKSRVLAYPKSFYSKLLGYLTAPVTHFVANDYRYLQPIPPQPTADTQKNDPLFGHVMERSWGFIFGCGPTRDNPHAQDGLSCA
jgi:hypothetical protein